MLQTDEDFARLVQTTDAIIPAVHEVRSALMRAGVSREDQRATFGQVDQHASDVSQTLEWIERDTEKWRLAMRTTKFGMRDFKLGDKGPEPASCGIAFLY